MTPERIKQLARIQASRNRPYYPHEAVVVLGDEWCALIAIAQRAGETCEWVPDADDSGDWVTACGRRWAFIDDGPSENKMHYCMGCGRTVAVRDGRTT